MSDSTPIARALHFVSYVGEVGSLAQLRRGTHPWDNHLSQKSHSWGVIPEKGEFCWSGEISVGTARMAIGQREIVFPGRA